MTKAPFSVEWLSQSSQATPQGRSSRAEGLEGASSSSSSDGSQAQLAAPPGSRSGQPAGRERRPSGAQDTRRVPEPPSPQEHGVGSCPAGLAAPKRAWSTTEGGSDGEGSLSEGQTPEDSSSGGGRSTNSRRLRTAFSLEQISTLESSFKRHKYLGAAERRKLASKMQLSEVQIKTWFQNRRMKLKRQLQEMRPDPFHAVPFYSPLPFGPQSGPLSYVYSAPQQTFSRREAGIPSGITFPPMPAPTLDPRNTSGGQPGALWPMPMPYFMGYQDPRTVFMSV
ncbi:homeobox protein VENTX [Elgaria multicarinata webbii]|uniref:homeobox protein VENTX n=1 Tax=Elgaria multicarinata webbii TaxID=159646 RepID=UPI002FCCC1F2